MSAFPVESVESHNEASFVRPPEYVGNPHHRVLQVGRSDLEVFLVKDNELQRVHGALPSSRS
jgi:hypothetical protein